MHPARLKVAVVSAGRVGTVLGAALARAGHHLTATYAVSQASRDRAAALLPGVPVRPLPDTIDGADLVLLTVPDDALGDLVAGLARTGSWQAGQIVVHTSGRYGVEVLEPALSSQVIPLAIHPAMTFTGTALDLGRLDGSAFGVTCAEGLRPIAEGLVVEMRGEPVWVPEGARTAYHAALAHGSNYLTTLVAQSLDILAAAGIENPAPLLAPLLRACLENALRLGDAALTGPVSRGDVGTVAAHLEELDRLIQRGDLDSHTRATYVALARASALRAGETGRLSAAAVQPLLDILDKEERMP